MIHQVVILCGGLGTRLGQITTKIPKSMIRFNNVPFLELLIKQLATQGFDDFLLLTGYKAEIIENHFGTGSSLGVRISYSRELMPLGTGGAMRLAKEKIKDRFLLLYGDIFRKFDYASFDSLDTNALAVYKYHDNLNSISNPNVLLSDDLSFIVGYKKERHLMNYHYVDAGFGYFSKHIIDSLPNIKSNWESTIYPLLSNGKNLRAIIVDTNFYDIGNLNDLEYAKLNLNPINIMDE